MKVIRDQLHSAKPMTAELIVNLCELSIIKETDNRLPARFMILHIDHRCTATTTLYLDFVLYLCGTPSTVSI